MSDETKEENIDVTVEPEIVSEGSEPERLKTKADIVASVVKGLHGKKKMELEHIHTAMSKANEVVTEAEKACDDEEEDSEEKGEKEMEEKTKKVTKEDIDFSNLTAIFESDESLSEDFKAKASTLFETAIVEAVNAKLVDLENEATVRINEEITNLTEKTSEDVDRYLSHIAESYVESNKLAIENSLKATIVEDFLRGLKTLFTESYIDIPDNKVNVVEEMASRVSELEEQLTEEIKTVVTLKNELESIKKDKIVSESIVDMTVMESDKFRGLAASVEFVSEEDFISKMNTIKETYFPKGSTNPSVITEIDPVDITEDTEVKTTKVDPRMATYVNALSRAVVKK